MAWEIVGKSGAGALLATGTYSGDGAVSQGITGLGFTPKLLIITDRQTADGTAVTMYWTTTDIVDDNASGGAIMVDDSGNTQFEINAIISLDADGFTVDDAGADSHPNTNGTTYNYVAIG